MPTRIVFANGSELEVAEEEADVVHAVHRDHPSPVALESAGGRPLHVNWDHVVWVGESGDGSARPA
jgi:hypothetical protein